MGVRLGFADVLFSKLADAPPPVAPGQPIEPRIANPSWAHRLEPLRVVTAQVLHQRYPHPASAAPAAGGIPVGDPSNPARGGSQAPSARSAGPSRPAAVKRTPRERLAIHLLNHLGAQLTEGATDEQVRRAYRTLVREAHPDRHPGADGAALDGHNRRLRAIVQAWAVFQGRAAAAA